MNTNTNRLLAAVLALQAVTLAGQWSGRAGSSEARADLPPNPAERQIAQLEEMKSLNSKLDRLVSLLEGGRLDVRVSNFAELKNMNKDNGNGNGNAKK